MNTSESPWPELDAVPATTRSDERLSEDFFLKDLEEHARRTVDLRPDPEIPYSLYADVEAHVRHAEAEELARWKAVAADVDLCYIGGLVADREDHLGIRDPKDVVLSVRYYAGRLLHELRKHPHLFDASEAFLAKLTELKGPENDDEDSPDQTGERHD
jgi:hypothetical protein